MATIYIVEDDINIREIERYALKNSGYEVEEFEGSASFFKRLEKNIPSLILLDIMLPGMNGFEIVQKMRANKIETPTLLLSALDEIPDKVKGLNVGADDYMTKPFDLYELLARIEANLKRTVDNPYQNNNTLVYKDIKINNSLVYINGVLVPFTSTELSILKLLLQYPQKIFSKQNLYESIWNEPYAYDDDTINTHISHIRKKIKSITNEDYIQTIWGIGYKMK